MNELCGKPVKKGLMPESRACMRPKGHYGRKGVGCFPDLTGMKFGNLVAIEQGPARVGKNGFPSPVWVVKHSFTREIKTVHMYDLLRGATTGMKVGLARKNGVVSPEYKTVASHRRWISQSIKPEHSGYKGMPFFDDWNPDKGGAIWKGAQWIIEHLGPKPGKEWSLDIVEHTQGFIPGNLRWAQKRTQKSNQQHRKLGHFSLAEIEMEAKRHGYRLVKMDA